MKRRSRHAFLALLLGAALVHAEEKKDAAALVADLRAAVRSDKSWDDRWEAYRTAKAAVDAAEAEFREELTKEQKEQLEKDKVEWASPAGKAYLAIRKEVADSLRRESLPANGWIMGMVGVLLLWGGFTFCVGRAVKAGKDAPPADD